jgi:hypothetical protein
LKLRPHSWRAVALGGVLILAMTTGTDAQLSRELGLDPPDSVTDAIPAVLPTEAGFALAQLRNPRVMNARVATRFDIKRLFHERGIRYPAAEVYLRIFKRERSLELWVRPDAGEEFALLKTYAICALAGELGPKRQQGDAQVPEGFYFIDFFNPYSDFHLSLHLDYPNQRDRLAGLEGVNLGGDIFIHGGCNSDGCLALTDDGIRELYWIAVEARAVGQQRIPVHIFPARLESEDLRLLQNAFRDQPELGHFWQSLKPGYDFFEENRRVPRVAVDAAGIYRVNGALADMSAPLGTPAGAGAGVQAGSSANGTGNGGAAVDSTTTVPVKPGTPPPLGTPVGAGGSGSGGSGSGGSGSGGPGSGGSGSGG